MNIIKWWKLKKEIKKRREINLHNAKGGCQFCTGWRNMCENNKDVWDHNIKMILMIRHFHNVCFLGAMKCPEPYNNTEKSPDDFISSLA